MSNFTLIKKNPTPGEVTSSLTNAEDGGLHFSNGGNISLTNAASAEFGTSDFSLEFVLNQTGDNASDNYLYLSHTSGNSRFYLYNDISADDLKLVFINSSGSPTTYAISHNMANDYNEPTHYVLSCDRSGNATLYKNGESVGSIAISGSSSVNIGDSNVNAGSISDATSGYGMLGTLSRFRTFNKLVDAQKLFENQNIDFSEQWGSQTSKLLNGVAWTGASGTTAPNSWTTGNQGTYTIDSSSGSGSEPALKIARSIDNPYIHQNFTAVIGAKYRISYKVKNIDATQANVGIGNTAIGSQYYLLGYSSTDWQTVNLEITATTSLISVYLQAITSTGTQAVYFDSVEIKQIGAVSSYELQAANPTQSLMVQDSSGAADGTCSASGVSQIQPLTQLNAVAARIGTSAATPADGEIVADTVSVSATGHDAAKITITNTASSNSRLLLNSGHGNWSVCNSSTIGDALEFRDESAAATRMSINSAGDVSINATGADQKRSLNIHGTNGSSEQQTFTIESDGENSLCNLKLGTGGGAASTKMSISSAGNVAIGSGTASEKLHLMADGSVGTRIERASNDGNSGVLDFYKTRGTLASKAIVGTADTVGALRAFGYDGSNYIQGGEIAFKTNGTCGTNDMPTQFVVSTTADGAASPTVRMSISSAGMTTVGPTHGAITFNNTSSVTGSTIIQQTYSGSNPELRIGSNVSSGATSAMNIRSGDAGLVTFNGGINFTQTNTAATGASTTAAIFSHYEVGTFTVTLGGASSVGITTGYYTRIGDTVHVCYYSGSFTSDGSAASITGLPFTVNTNKYGGFFCYHNTYVPTADTGYFSVNTTTGYFTASNTTSSAASANASGRYLMFTGTYKV